MAEDRHALRRDKLIRNLRNAGADALLVTNPTNVSYLTGFTGEDSFLIVGPKATVLISDGRFATQIDEECPNLDVVIRTPQQTILDATAGAARRAGIAKLAFESDAMSHAQWERLGSALKATERVPMSGAVEELRLVKDSDEIEQIREAAKQAERGFDVLRASITPQMTELEAAHTLEHAMRQFGARKASFETIVAVGSRSALPHARPTERRIGEAPFVLVDWGASNAAGYKSDLTRVLATGKISTKLEKVYRVVLNAQRRGIAAIRPGARGCDVDAAARRVIAKAGWGRLFRHSLGHGIGLDIHEGPRLAKTAELRLRPGMVVTVEPGVYIPGWGGVRIEDDVLVTRKGCELLTSVSTRLEDMIVG
ncbi:MAG: M24 family metallopeptidase [Planctomycetaceae bacterium]